MSGPSSRFESEPIQRLFYVPLSIRIVTIAVGVLDAKDELAAGLARQKPIVEGRCEDRLCASLQSDSERSELVRVFV